MSINMELMRKKLAQLQGKAEEDSVWFKPQEGETDIQLRQAMVTLSRRCTFTIMLVSTRAAFCALSALWRRCAICDFASSLEGRSCQ